MDEISQGIINAVGTLEARLEPMFQFLGSKSFGLAERMQAIVEKIPISKHSQNFPLMNPFHVLVIVVAYLLMVPLGKFVMGNVGEKFSLKTYSLIHNFLMVSLSLYMGIEVLRQAFMAEYSLFGNDHDQSVKGIGMAKIVWVFYFSKILEFNDTFIMILKKNFRQVSFLHVYHHSSIFGVWWLVSYMAPNGEAYFSAMLNSFVHVIMYGYYFLSALGFKQVSFIKYYITKTQMLQFVMMMVQATFNIASYYFTKEKDTLSPNAYPIKLSVILWVYMVSMLGLFANFLIQDQKQRKKAKTL